MYDPLSDKHLPPAQHAVDSYWEKHTKVRWPDTASMPKHSDVLIIGAGYTGLNAAKTLAESYQQQVTVIDANRIAWGCSSRNAGFVMKSTGRLGLSQWADRLGDKTAKAIADEHQTALELVKQWISQSPDQCDVQRGGYIKLAHRAKAIEPLRQQYQTLKQFNQPVSWLSGEQLSEQLNNRHALAGLKFDDCVSVNPLKLAAVTAQQTAKAGVDLVENCSALSVKRLADGWQVETTEGAVSCSKLLICTNAYTANKLVPALTGRSLPALSSIITTPPLTQQQLADTGLTPAQSYMDTRILKYYFRLLPDNRLLMGGRGAIRGKQAHHPSYAKQLLKALKQSFPGLATIDHWQHFWSGWVSVSLDDYPRVGAIGDNLYAAMGYCGAGVSFSSLAGKRLAQAAMGEELPRLPYYQSPLKRFPMPSMRRVGQWAYYHYARLTE
ncbi:FAD-binding oxidoreductase [Idiomarina seosinensis]|uniref:FAD-binding oxidoreductase n=2 Tax=Idiomarina seosinensis TaxID=281739 RepID=A0A432ZEQ4_9GAMM|nr:FAD-binding oxidoreductase [Idiomarina seosinensis]